MIIEILIGSAKDPSARNTKTCR